MELQKGKEVGPGMIVYDNVLQNIPHYISKLFEYRNEWDMAKIALNVDEEHMKEIRNSKTMELNINFSEPKEWYELSQIIWKYGDSYAKTYNISFLKMEPVQFLHYEKKEGRYGFHSDDCPDLPRIFSAVLYLNDVDEGGETYFDNFDIYIKPKAGRIVLFPANYVYTHTALPPISSEKMCLVSWFTPDYLSFRE
jgi:hypothetical protein